MSFGTPWVGHSQDCGGGPRSGEEEGTGSRRALKEGPDSPAETYDHKVDLVFSWLVFVGLFTVLLM